MRMNFYWRWEGGGGWYFSYQVIAYPHFDEFKVTFIKNLPLLPHVMWCAVFTKSLFLFLSCEFPISYFPSDLRPFLDLYCCPSLSAVQSLNADWLWRFRMETCSFSRNIKIMGLLWSGKKRPNCNAKTISNVWGQQLNLPGNVTDYHDWFGGGEGGGGFTNIDGSKLKNS